MDKRIEIPISKTKILLLLVGSLIFVIGGIWLAIKPEVFIPNIFRVSNIEIIRIFGIAGILFFGAAIIYGFRKMFDKKIGLAIDSNGIYDNSNASSVGLIEWSDITNIRTEKVASTNFFLIDVVDNEKYLLKANGKFQLMLLKANMKKYDTPLSITLSTLNSNFKDLEELLKEQFQKNRKFQ